MFLIFKIVAVILIFYWGWHVRVRYFEAMKTNRTLRNTTLVVNGTAVVIIVIMLLWHFTHNFFKFG